MKLLNIYSLTVLWHKFFSKSKQLKQYYKNLIFDKKEYFFGFESGDLLVNLISIIATNYIFKCKLNEQGLNIVEFKHKIMWYPFTWTIYIKEKQYRFSIWKNVDNIFSTNHNIFCLFDSYSDEILFSAFLIKYKMSGAIKYFRKTKW